MPWKGLGSQEDKNPPAPSCESLAAAHEAPGSLWRLHLKGERYAVDVKLPGVGEGNQEEADLRVKLAGLDVSWLVPIEGGQSTPESEAARSGLRTGRLGGLVMPLAEVRPCN